MTRRLYALVAFALIACGGPLDRVDGRLIIELVDLPLTVDRVDVEIRAGGRSFSQSLPRVNLIEEFSAVPVGPAQIDIALFAGEALVAERTNLEVEISVDAVRTLLLNFGDPPEVVVDAPASHFVGDGPIVVEVRDVVVDRDATLILRAGGNEVVKAPSGNGWSANVDPLLGSPIVPYLLELEAEVCYPGDPPTCARYGASVRVHREVWTATVSGRPTVSPVQAGARVVVAADDGVVSVFDAERGTTRSVTLEPPLYAGIAVLQDSVYVVDGTNALRGIDLDTLARTPWSVELGGTRASDIVVDDDRLIVGASRRLLAIDPTMGATTELWIAPAAIRARPWIDARGIVAVDVVGNVHALDTSDAVAFDVRLDTPVRAGAARIGDVVWLATLDGRLIPIVGGAAETPVDAEEPIGHPLIVADGRLVAAAGSALVFVDDRTPTFHRLGAPLTGAPTPFLSDVLVGLRNGLFTVVSRAGTVRPLVRVAGTALGPRPIDELSTDVIVTGSSGEISRIRAEEDF